MPGLLIDRKVLVKHKINKLLDIAGNPPKTKDDVGIIFLIPQKQYKTLLELSDVNDKITYISSKSFIDKVTGSYFIIYNEKRKICEIRGYVGDQEHLNSILKSINVYMPRDITVWAGVVPIDKSEHYISAGFDNPHIADHSPLQHSFIGKGVAFSKKNSNQNSPNANSVRNKLRHASTQTGDVCNIYARFTHNALIYLQDLNESKQSNEQAGSFVVSNVVKEGSKLVFELSPDPGNTKDGKSETVDAVWSRYNFHTHPKKAYENHGVTRGWPSSQDFVGFLQLDNHTVFHTVVTLEGIYIISISPEWHGDVRKVDKKFVLNHYDIDHKTKIDFKKYTDIINIKKYKGSQLFVVKYLPWDSATDSFPVYYATTGGKCLASEEAFEMYKK
jgi:hypothetical protein